MKKKIMGIILVTLSIGLSSNALASSSDLLETADQIISSSYARSINKEDLTSKISNFHKDIENSNTSMNDQDYFNLLEKREKIDNLLDTESSLSKSNNRAAKSWRYGDVLIYKAGNKNVNGEKSYTGHSAVLSTTSYNVIEANKMKKYGNKVFHWNRNNVWKGASGIVQFRVASVLGKSASATQRKKAVSYGLKQVGKPYALKTTLNDTSKWYCSKLTYKQWKDAGYDISGKFIKGIVTPDNLSLDANMWVKKVWKTSVPGLI